MPLKSFTIKQKTLQLYYFSSKRRAEIKIWEEKKIVIDIFE